MNDKLPMAGKELAYWLADKIPALGDYAKEAAEVLRKQADEIERLNSAPVPMTREQIAEELQKCKTVPELWDDAVIVFAEHILRIGTIALREENKRLRGDSIECHQGRDIISSLSDAMNNLPACGMLAIVGAAMQEIDALRSGEFIRKKCGLRKDADNFFKDGTPF